MLNSDYKEMLELLLDVNCDFIVVGAYALAAHGHPRATGDIDIWVRPAHDNAISVMKALAAFGAPIVNLTIEDLSQTGNVFQIGVAPCRIDILTNIDGVTFDEAYQSLVRVEVDGLSVPFLSREMLIKNKLATGRLKDRADAEELGFKE